MNQDTKTTIQGRVLRAFGALLVAILLLSGFSAWTIYQAQSSYQASRADLLVNRETLARLNAALQQLESGVKLRASTKSVSPLETDFLRRARAEFSSASTTLTEAAHSKSFAVEVENVAKQISRLADPMTLTDIEKLREAVVSADLAISKVSESDLQQIIMNLIFVVVAVAFATVAIPLVSIWITTRKVNADLFSYVKSLYVFSSENERASEELEAASLDLASASNQQSAAVEQTVASITEIRSMLSETETHISEVRDLTMTMNEKTQDGAKIMARVETAMLSIEQANSQLESFKEMIQSIRGKTRVINDIVFKTQLLSFNASIEAARAGQYGRGFSVVAEEVGKLAQISGDASREIDTLLGTSQDRVVKIVGAIQTRVSDGKTISHEAMERFAEIAREIATISEKISQVSDASTEQASGVEQTAKAMDQMSESTIKNKLGAEQVNQIGGRVRELSQRIREVTEGIRRFVREGDGSSLKEGQNEVQLNTPENLPLSVTNSSDEDHSTASDSAPTRDNAAILQLVSRISQKHVDPTRNASAIRDITADDLSFKKSGDR